MSTETAKILSPAQILNTKRYSFMMGTRKWLQQEIIEAMKEFADQEVNIATQKEKQETEKVKVAVKEEKLQTEFTGFLKWVDEKTSFFEDKDVTIAQVVNEYINNQRQEGNSQ